MTTVVVTKEKQHRQQQQQQQTRKADDANDGNDCATTDDDTDKEEEKAKAVGVVKTNDDDCDGGDGDVDKDVVNPYHILELRRDATNYEIRTAYQRLALLYHPGRGRLSSNTTTTSTSASTATTSANKKKTSSDNSNNGLAFRRRLRHKQTMFEIVAACYETLVDVESRRKYDQYLKKQEMERRENQRRLHLLRQLVGSNNKPTRTQTRTTTPRTSTGRNVNPKKRNDVVRILPSSSSSSLSNKKKMKKTSGCKLNSSTHKQKTRDPKMTTKKKSHNSTMNCGITTKNKKRKKASPNNNHHDDVRRPISMLSPAAASALIEYEDGQGVYTTDKEFKQKIMIMDKNNQHNHSHSRHSHNKVKSKNHPVLDDETATATAPEGSLILTGTAASVSSSSSVCGDSSSSSFSGDNHSNGCIDDEQQRQRQSSNAHMLDRFATEANASCCGVGDVETNTATANTTSGGDKMQQQQQQKQLGLQDFEISHPKNSTTDKHGHTHHYEQLKNGNEPPCLTRSSSFSSDCSSFYSTSTVEIAMEEEDEDDEHIKMTNTSMMTTEQADDEVLPLTIDPCSGMNIGLRSCFHPIIESKDSSTSELLQVKEDKQQSHRRRTMVSTRGGRGREGLPTITLSNSFSSSSSEFSSSSLNNKHFSEKVVNQLFGGPLAPLHRARNFVPFTDPYIIFERVFGRSLFPRVKHSMNSNINDRHKIQQQSLSVQHDTRKNHRAVTITEYQKTKTSTKPSTGVIHEISRMVGDRIITRTEMIETNPSTGRRTLSVVVNSTDLATDSNDDLDGTINHCDSLSALFSSIQYVLSQFQW